MASAAKLKLNSSKALKKTNSIIGNHIASFDITPILKLMIEKGGSDLFFSTGTAVHIDIEGETIPVNNQTLAPSMIKEVAYSLMSEVQIKEFEETMECNFALSKKDT